MVSETLKKKDNILSIKRIGLSCWFQYIESIEINTAHQKPGVWENSPDFWKKGGETPLESQTILVKIISLDSAYQRTLLQIF